MTLVEEIPKHERYRGPEWWRMQEISRCVYGHSPKGPNPRQIDGDRFGRCPNRDKPRQSGVLAVGSITQSEAFFYKNNCCFSKSVSELGSIAETLFTGATVTCRLEAYIDDFTFVDVFDIINISEKFPTAEKTAIILPAAVYAYEGVTRPDKHHFFYADLSLDILLKAEATDRPRKSLRVPLSWEDFRVPAGYRGYINHLFSCTYDGKGINGQESLNYLRNYPNSNALVEGIKKELERV